jgi:hypothetical protein
MDIKWEGKPLLDNHKKLFEQLIEIPEKREMIYFEEMIDSVRVGNPRFKNPKYQWITSLLIDVRDHLQNIWNFFSKYSYWFDDTLIPLLNTDERRISKKSIIFLLEEDVWCTDEVYGRYFIEENQDGITISYSRRERKMKQITLKSKNGSEIKDWICKDAIIQIKNQFKFLWGKLETEIQVCIDEIFHKQPKLTFKPDYLKNQLEKTITISEQWPEAGLLNLGRIIELWLLTSLGKKSTSRYVDIIREAQIAEILDKHEAKLLRNIRTNYNNLKHKTYYKIEIEEIKTMVERFSNLFNS